MLTNDDPNPPHIGNLPFSDQISLYYVLWIILVQAILFSTPFPHITKSVCIFTKWFADNRSTNYEGTSWYLPIFQPHLHPIHYLCNDKDCTPIKYVFEKRDDDCSQWRCALQHGRLGDNAAIYSPNMCQTAEYSTHKAKCENQILIESDR